MLLISVDVIERNKGRKSWSGEMERCRMVKT